MILQISDISNCDFIEGSLLLVDKPTGWTSFDVVNKLRWTLRNHLGVKKIKVGHSGTLDPMATGLLLICTGKWTKRLQELQGLDKEYTGQITLGAETPSYDAETEVSKEYSIDSITCEQVSDKMNTFVGVIDQLPPVYSAIKVDGKPLYKAARAGKTVKVEPRKVTIHDFRMDRCELPIVEFTAACSKGTYVRSLAHDLGQELGCGGYLTGLRRTKVGEYLIEDAWELDKLVSGIQQLSEHSTIKES